MKRKKIRYTKADHEKHLNRSPPDFESNEWIIGGHNRAKFHFPDFGSVLRRFDSIQFDVGFNERRLELEKGAREFS